MNRVPVADWAASVPWTGITGKPGGIGQPVDLSNVTWAGVPANRYPVWNGTRFVPTALVSPGGGSSSITVVDEPAIAVRRRPPGQPSDQYENVWARYEANVKLFGAIGNGGTTDTDSINSAINSVNDAGGGSLYFPAGRYYLGGDALNQITVPCRVRGDGVGVSVLLMGGADALQMAAGTALVDFSAQDITIEDAGIAFQVQGGRFFGSFLGIECEHLGFSLDGVLGGAIRDTFMISVGTATAVYGEASDLGLTGLRLLGDGPWQEGIHLTAGTACIINDCFAANVAGDFVVLDSSVSGCRIHDLSFRDVGGSDIVSDAGVNNYTTGLFGLGGNANSDYDSRREIYSIFAWNPGSMPPGYGWYEDFNIPGAMLGDQVTHGVPYLFGPEISVDSRTVASDTIRITLTNFGTSTVDLDSGDWKLRTVN